MHVLLILEFQILNSLANGHDCVAVRPQFIGIYCRSCLTCDEMKSRSLAQEFVERRTRIFLCSPVLSMTPSVTHTQMASVFTLLYLKRITVRVFKIHRDDPLPVALSRVYSGNSLRWVELIYFQAYNVNFIKAFLYHNVDW